MAFSVDIVARFRAGEPEALDFVVRSCIGRLRSTAVRLLSDRTEADDAVQDAFVSAFRSLTSFRGDADLATWLHRIVVNACLMRIRARRSFDVVVADEIIGHWLPRFYEDGHRIDPVVPWVDSVEELLDRAETAALVRASIDAMPEPHRSILLLRDIEELSTREAADALGLQVNAVKVRLHRARQALRAMLQVRLEEARA